MQYLNELYVENKHNSISLFADNLQVHKTLLVRELLEDLDIVMTYNVPYQPDYNPTESCLSVVKNYYKRQKLNKLVNEEEVDHQQLIVDSINQLDK